MSVDFKKKVMEEAITHFRHGITHDLFSEPVATYARLAVEALESQMDTDHTEDEYITDMLLDNGVTFQEPIPVKTYNDLLNSMSIEEKAAFIPYICRNARKVHPNAKRYRPTELVRVCLKSEYTCSECLLHFLRHPVEGEIIHG